MEFDGGIPIYRQIADSIKIKIISGVFERGGKIPSVRELALEYGVNPNTAQRALAELERENLLYAERTNGRFVTDDAKAIKAAKVEMLFAEIDKFLSRMKSMGYSGGELIDALRRFI